MPVYNDWEVADLVCRELDAVFARQPTVELQIVMIDDGSSSDGRRNFWRGRSSRRERCSSYGCAATSVINAPSRSGWPG